MYLLLVAMPLLVASSLLERFVWLGDLLECESDQTILRRLIQQRSVQCEQLAANTDFQSYKTYFGLFVAPALEWAKWASNLIEAMASIPCNLYSHCVPDACQPTAGGEQKEEVGAARRSPSKKISMARKVWLFLAFGPKINFDPTPCGHKHRWSRRCSACYYSLICGNAKRWWMCRLASFFKDPVCRRITATDQAVPNCAKRMVLCAFSWIVCQMNDLWINTLIILGFIVVL